MGEEGVLGGDDTLGTSGVPQVGHLVGGKFIVERVLGVGGMGVVVAARHVQLGQTVAIKFLRSSAAKSDESVNRFLREARASVGLESAHVVRVMDVGTLEDGLPYMVMEHLNGTDLEQFLEVRHVLPVLEAVDYLCQAMDAVAEAHALGIVHRDLKPSNLFLTLRPDGSPLVKVLDFGISKAVDCGPSVNLTATAAVLGSPLYMSPEQVRSTKNVDTRTDIWALGVILYELIAGAPPFEAETVTGLCAKIVADPPVSLRSRRPDVPVALETIIARCLDKDVARRYRSVPDLALALRPFASADGQAAVDRITRISRGSRSTLPSVADTRRPPSGPVDGEHLVTGYAETLAASQKGPARNARRVALALGVIGLAGVLAIGVAFRRNAFKQAEAVPASRVAGLTPMRAVRILPEASVRAWPEASVRALPEASVRALPEASVRALPEASVRIVSEASVAVVGSAPGLSTDSLPPLGAEPPTAQAGSTRPIAARPPPARAVETLVVAPRRANPDDLLLDRK